MAIQLGKKHRLISGAQGPKSPNVGRIVVPTHIVPGVPHTVWGEIYHCEPTDGEPFHVKHEGKDRALPFCHAPEDWLEPIDDDEDTTKNETKEELTA